MAMQCLTIMLDNLMDKMVIDVGLNKLTPHPVITINLM